VDPAGEIDRRQHAVRHVTDAHGGKGPERREQPAGPVAHPVHLGAQAGDVLQQPLPEHRPQRGHQRRHHRQQPGACLGHAGEQRPAGQCGGQAVRRTAALAARHRQPGGGVPAEVRGGRAGDGVGGTHRRDDAERPAVGVGSQHLGRLSLARPGDQPGDEQHVELRLAGQRHLHRQADIQRDPVGRPPQLGHPVRGEPGHRRTEIGLGGDGRGVRSQLAERDHGAAGDPPELQHLG
jgi:hypothetical protein